MSSSEIFEWTALVFKYTGYASLPGLYEPDNRSKTTKIFLEQLLPLLFFLSGISTAVSILVFGITKPRANNLSDLLMVIVQVLISLRSLCFPLVYYFRLNPRLVRYLKRSKSIDSLLEPSASGLKNRANAVLVAFLVTGSAFITLFHYSRFVRYDDRYAHLLVLDYASNLVNAIFAVLQPQTAYIVFQMILKCAFNRLNRLINENRGRKCDRARVERKLSEYSALYCSLCQLCGQLGHAVSPLLAYQFLYNLDAAIFNFTFLINYPASNVFYLTGILSTLTNLLVLISLPNFAYNTQKSASNILPSIFSTFKLKDKLGRNEINMFGLQSMVLKRTFTASGLFNIDRELILTIIQYVITQWVVFYKINRDDDIL